MPTSSKKSVTLKKGHGTSRRVFPCAQPHCHIQKLRNSCLVYVNPFTTNARGTFGRIPNSRTTLPTRAINAVASRWPPLTGPKQRSAGEETITSTGSKHLKTKRTTVARNKAIFMRISRRPVREGRPETGGAGTLWAGMDLEARASLQRRGEPI